jgi:hypothetical protein
VADGTFGPAGREVGLGHPEQGPRLPDGLLEPPELGQHLGESLERLIWATAFP